MATTLLECYCIICNYEVTKFSVSLYSLAQGSDDLSKEIAKLIFQNTNGYLFHYYTYILYVLRTYITLCYVCSLYRLDGTPNTFTHYNLGDILANMILQVFRIKYH